jgi:16S rRNA (cytosine1402-N4)-methyltransferase
VKDKIKNLYQENFHTPVMKEEVIKFLISNQLQEENNKEPMYIDTTVGGGGHCELILENISRGIVVGLDCDMDAIEFTKHRLAKYDNLYLYHTNYTNIDKVIIEFPKNYLQGVLFDLGISSHQINTANRGFSYSVEGPLDMRFNQTMPSRLAREIIHYCSLSELQKIFFDYGEESQSKRIAEKIFAQRKKINTTTQLANIIRQFVPAHQLNKTLSRIFQSLRIVVNRELENIKVGLEKAIKLLIAGGRIVVISYHSLEDRIVKQTFRNLAHQEMLKILTKKPLRPELSEVLDNPRARSARLRAAERL